MREYKQNSVKYGTYQLYHQIYRLYIQDKIGDECMASIRPDQIQSIYNELSAEGHMPEDDKFNSGCYEWDVSTGVSKSNDPEKSGRICE